MTDAINLHSFPRAATTAPSAAAARPAAQQPLVPSHEAIGRVVEVGGSGARVEITGRCFAELAHDADPSIAMSGQVGSQIKIASDRRWLLANVRSLKVTDAEAGTVSAEVDFLGEGDEDPSTGKLVNFKRGITSLPDPGQQGLSGLRRRSEADVRRRRARPYRDRHGLSDQGRARARSMSMPCSASISPCSARPAPANRPPPR